MATTALNVYTVKVYKPNSVKIERFTAIARSWYDAWESAANTYGLRALYSVTPHTYRQKVRS